MRPTAPINGQPDDPGVTPSIVIDEPVIFGNEKAELTANTIRMIRKNAGRVPPFKIAEALRWSYKRMERVAKANGISLRYPPRDQEPEPRGA